MNFYHIAVQLKGKKCLVVGGGKIAQRKIQSLLRAGADVTVVCPQYTPLIQHWEEQKRISLYPREFLSSDVLDMNIIIAATDNPKVNLRVYELTDQSQWINVVDRPDLCNFMVPAVVERGSLKIAISTGGTNPGFAKKLKLQMEKIIGPEYEEYVNFLGTFRKEIQDKQLSLVDQNALLKELLHDRFLEWTRQGELELRDKEARKILKLSPENN
jgi:precorrin-2 dehydrogenase/sirohydrochlorin ferrochelatase